MRPGASDAGCVPCAVPPAQLRWRKSNGCPRETDVARRRSACSEPGASAGIKLSRNPPAQPLRPMTTSPNEKLQRRTFLTLSLGWCSAAFACLASAAAAARFLVPNVLYEPDRRFKALKPEDYTEGPTFMPNLRVFLFRKGNTFRAA